MYLHRLRVWYVPSFFIFIYNRNVFTRSTFHTYTLYIHMMMKLSQIKTFSCKSLSYVRQLFHKADFVAPKTFSRSSYETRACRLPSSCCCYNHHLRWYNDNKSIPLPANTTDSNDGSSKMKNKKYDPTAKRPNRLCDPYGQGGRPLSYEDATKLRTTLHTDWIFHMPPTIEVENISSPRIHNEGIHIRKQDESSATTTANMNDDTHNFDKTVPSVTKPNMTPLMNINHNVATGSTSTSAFPMYTAIEEVQRILASLPQTTTASSSVPPAVSSDQKQPSVSNESQQHTKQNGTVPSSSPLALIRTFQHPDFMSGSRFVQSIAAVAQLTAHYPKLILDRKIIHGHWYIISTVQCHTLVLGGLSSFDFHLATVRSICVCLDLTIPYFHIRFVINSFVFTYHSVSTFCIYR